MLKSVLKYLFSTLLAASLLYWAFAASHLEWEDIYRTFLQANYRWVSVAIIISLLSHWLRALRWEQLLESLSYQPGQLRTLSAVLIGYFANFIVPRMGEVSRCGSLQKTADIPFEKSFGTVITERIIDLLGLVGIVGITFLVEWKPIQAFLFPHTETPPLSLIAGLIVIALIGLITLWFTKDFILAKWEVLSKSSKVGQILSGWIDGIISIKGVKKPGLFLLYTAAIWLAYFLNAYTLLLAFNSTENLGLAAGLSILVMGTFGMATPTQGGIGAYHSLVASTLVLYQIDIKEATALATFFHGTQMATILLFGGISFILTLFLPKKINRVNS
ncbi:lysylphosphatidylglycerol synthase transmembrane domain-containing protein [Aquirufa rosea]|uniref:Flippase-like domain-containing protein n=1 Tax=Aquirufa rosea TaxID=2509241 RepID=A0A4Q1BXP8_9BACT|nr:lysylphosphatidylglycerol synthase transmembrane domain-containing protein [Aquirufa rosea]RXK47149.1 flippase-like domain-containing protein [Aquirufa rosea]